MPWFGCPAVAHLYPLGVSMPILRYVIVPLLIVYVAYLLIFESTRRFPIYVLSAFAILGVLALVRNITSDR